MRNRLRAAIDRGMAGVALSPSQKRRIYRLTIEGGEENVETRRKLPLVLALTLAVMLAVAGIALATGVAQSVFGAMRDMYVGEDASKYQALERLAADGATDVPLTIVEGMRFVLTQSYYDGEQLMLGYRLEGKRPAADLSFGPGHKQF
ncbi:MAG: DUF4179 domain-containing protein, partial [Clostridiales bacterium]|nr:DUF4179 domain-containing protein [Clostridiales bacterium]